MTFARIGVFETEGQPLDPVVDLFRDKITAEFARLDGFVGYQAFVDDEARRYIGISYWTSLAAVQASAAVATAAREEAHKLGARTIAEPMIVRQAFDTRTD